MVGYVLLYYYSSRIQCEEKGERVWGKVVECDVNTAEDKVHSLFGDKLNVSCTRNRGLPSHWSKPLRGGATLNA